MPFENVSKLLLLDAEGGGQITTLPEFLDGIEYMDLGGTCCTGNPFLAGLLLALGYDADLLGADMSNPNVHTSVRVRLGPVAYHVDVGYAAPFRQAMRLDQLPDQVVHGDTRYVLDRNSGGEGYSMTVFHREERVHGYVVHDPPRPPEFFHPIILDSYVLGRTFTNGLRITRFFEDGLVAAARNSLAMPRCPVEKAVRVLERIAGKPFFAEDAGGDSDAPVGPLVTQRP